jgi:hypothetical protein
MILVKWLRENKEWLWNGFNWLGSGSVDDFFANE